MENKEITAVEWIVSEMINKMGIRIENTEVGIKLFNQAKQMEKQQIINTCEDVDSITFWVNYRSFEEYYNEKFKSE